MNSSLGSIQREFTRLVGKLIEKIYADGYEATFGDANRSDEQAEINAIGEEGRAAVAADIVDQFPHLARALLNNGKSTGIRLSIHQLRLAVDLNLFKDGKYLSDTESHRPFGEWWEKQHPLARWGGRFRDGNHYSFEFNRIK